MTRIHHFIKHAIDISLSVLVRVEKEVLLDKSMLNFKLLFNDTFILFIFLIWINSSSKIDPNNRCTDLVHTLLVRYIRVFFAPDKKNITKNLDNIEVSKKLLLLICSLDILSDFVLQELIISFLHQNYFTYLG
jgi:hypothetical protein